MCWRECVQKLSPINLQTETVQVMKRSYREAQQDQYQDQLQQCIRGSHRLRGQQDSEDRLHTQNLTFQIPPEMENRR